MIQGACLCRAVRFTVEEFKGGVFKCHCSKCRKAFGGASSAAALCTQDKFTWLQGESDIHHFQTDSGFTRYFCPRCGSILPQHLPEHGMFWIPAGLLESDPGLSLRQHIHVDSRAAWEVLDENTPTRPEGF